jgi:hypothetical protein
MRGIKAPPKFKKRRNVPRVEPKPSEFNALDRYLAGRNIEGQEFSKKVEIEI